MSLPPISHFNRNDPSMPSKCFYYNFSTTTSKKLSNPIHSLNLKKLAPGVTLTKACDVMSSVPPSSLNHSKFSISRLSPVLPMLQVPKKKTVHNYLKGKYTDYLDIDKKSEFSFHFDRPIRDYFQETVEIQNNTNKNDPKTEVVDISPTPARIMGKDQKYLKPKYCSVVMPVTRDNDKSVNIELKKQKTIKEYKGKNDRREKKLWDDGRVIHQSLQTDANSFEFDEWELDYES